jgi:KUP system potassium uptake protein
MDTSYFVSRDIVVPRVAPGLPAWRAKLFAAMQRNAARAADFLALPANRVVELGAKIEL